MKIYLTLLTFLFFNVGQAQEWVEKMQDPSVNFYEVQRSFNDAWEGRAYEKGNGYKQFKRWEWFMEPRVFPSGRRPNGRETFAAWTELQKRQKAPQAKSAANWTPLGPTSWTTTSYNPGNGRVNVIAVDPSNSSIIYVGTPSGGIWKTTTGGNAWSPLFDDMPTMGISGIAIDPTNSNNIFIATGDGDGADTYSIGVLRSTDGGMSWNTTGLIWATTQSQRTYKLLMHPNDPNTLLCASNAGLFKTTDAGASWTLTLQGVVRDVEYRPGDPTIVYASKDEFFKSTDGGDSFGSVSIGLPLPADVNRMSIAVSENNPIVVYALCGAQANAGFQGLYRSMDAGNSFTLRSDSPNIFSYPDDGSGSGGQSWYDMALAVDPANAQTVYAAGINVWKSTDGGQNWTIKSHWVWPSTIGYTHADVHTLDFYGNILYCGSDGGVFRSTSGANTWVDISSGLNIMQFYRMGGTEMNPSLIMAGAQDNGSNRYDGSWTHVLGADGMEAAIDPTDPMVMYAATQNGGLTRSDNGGQGFSGITADITDDGGWVTPYVIDPADHNRLYAGYQDLWRTDDKGDNWIQLTSYSPSENVRVLAVAPSDPDHIYFGNELWLRHSSNGGNAWNIITNNLPLLSPTSIAVHPLDPTVVYATFSGYEPTEKVFVYNSTAQYWENLSMGLPNLPVNTVAFQDGTQGGIYVGTDLGVFYKDSTLSTWQPFDQGLPDLIVNELEINYSAGKIRAATYGRGIWESDLFTTSTQPPVAGFTHTSAEICAGQSIQFFDNSLDASPSWNWQFPGGTPASSTSPSPTVTYPASGNYTATLTMSNANGSDTFSTTVPVTVQPNALNLSISFDDYASESSWRVFDQTGNEAASGGPYTTAQNNTTRGYNFCLADGCYTFFFYDSYGDGICCGFGNGSYTLSSAVQGVLATGGQFTFQDSTSFCTFSVGVEQQSSSDLPVIPNPTSGEVTISLPSNNAGQLRILDAAGRLVLKQVTSQRSIQLNLGDRPAGTYLVEWKSKEQRYSVPLLLMK